MSAYTKYALVGAAIATVALTLALRWTNRRHEAVRRITSHDEITALLDPPKTTLQQLLRSRALPNERLIRALGMTNTFVSDDPFVHSAFVRAAKMLIAGANPRDQKGWNRWIDEVSKCIDRYLPLDSIQFSTYMQSVTFSIVLTGFLDADLAALDPREVASVTKAINERWMQAKTSQQLHPHLLSEINDHIFRWVPNRDQYPNPLDFIIPAFETMWRVVAITTVYAYRDESIRHAFLDFGDNLTIHQFRAFKKAGPSVEAVVLEVLRLYPPTRRISRVNPSSLSKFPFAASTPESDSIEVAEIETYHRSQEWGENPTEFDPMRYHPSKGASDLFAFGYGRLKCVASSWAPIAAATIVARILERVDKREFEIEEGEAIGRRDGWGGWSIKRKP